MFYCLGFLIGAILVTAYNIIIRHISSTKGTLHIHKVEGSPETKPFIWVEFDSDDIVKNNFKGIKRVNLSIKNHIDEK